MFLRQSLRSRRLQVIVLIGISTLIAGCAAFGPLFARAVEQSILATSLTTQRGLAAFHLSADPGAPLDAEDLAAKGPSGYGTLFEEPQLGYAVDVSWYETPAQTVGITGSMRWTEGFCDHLVMVQGRCPTGPNEIVLSVADLANYRDTYRVASGGRLWVKSTGLPARKQLRVTGIYRTDPADPFWYGVAPIGNSQPGEVVGGNSDTVFTSRSTFATAPWGQAAQVWFAPLPGGMQPEDLPVVDAWAAEANARLNPEFVTLNTGFGVVRTTVDDGRRQAARIIPLVMSQVAIFGLVVLTMAAAAAIDQRRPELAIARLRGRSPARAGRDVFAEMGVLVLIGTVLGGVLAFGVNALVRRLWLAGTAPAELPWPTFVFTAAALIAGLAAILLALRPVVRLPVATLLRTVPARRRGRVFSTVQVVLVTAAVVGLAATLTGDGRGALAIITPTLLAVAAGLLVAGVVVAVSGSLGTKALRRGRLAAGLAALQVSRRRIAGRLVPVIAVGTALVAFAGQSAAIATRNREVRSGLETGAHTVLSVSDNDVRRVRSTLDTVDKSRAWSTLVATTSPLSAQSLVMVGIEPDSFRRIAIGGADLADDATYRRIAASKVAPISFRGSQVLLTAGPLQAQDGFDRRTTRTVSIRITYVNTLRVRTTATLGAVPVDGSRPVTLRAPVDCYGGCQLLQVRVARAVGDAGRLAGTLTLSGLRGNADTAPAQFGTSGWTEIGAGSSEADSLSAVPAGGTTTGLRLRFTSIGAELTTQNAWVPAVVPVIAAADAEVSDSGTSTAPGLDGVPLTIRTAGPATGPVPRNLYRSTVTDLTTLTRWGGPEPTLQTTAEIWLDGTGAKHVDEVIAAFGKAGITVEVLERLSDSDARYGQSASALALRLTPLVGVAAWSLALVVLLLLAVSTRRGRIHDNAGLQLAGVGPRLTTRSLRIEQVGLVGLSAVAGTVCGVVGGQLALPLIPLFVTEQPAVPIDLGVSWPTAASTLVVSTAVLCAGALLVVRGLRRGTRFGVIREELS